MRNEFLKVYREHVEPDDSIPSWPQTRYIGWPDGEAMIAGWKFRELARSRYAYAVPDDGALDAIAAYGPIVEIGAGLGYWAALLRARGVDVVAFDDFSWDILHKEPRWTTIKEGGTDAVRGHGHRALFLCWPPYSHSMANHALACYDGGTVIYVGEGEEGCTGDEAFHDKLERHWHVVREVAIPQLPYVHDRLWIYRRRAAWTGDCPADGV
jgi:hypothetical protein